MLKLLLDAACFKTISCKDFLRISTWLHIKIKKLEEKKNMQNAARTIMQSVTSVPLNSLTIFRLDFSYFLFETSDELYFITVLKMLYFVPTLYNS